MVVVVVVVMVVVAVVAAAVVVVVSETLNFISTQQIVRQKLGLLHLFAVKASDFVI